MKKILIVDDEKDICDRLKAFLNRRGFEVISVLDGQQAYDIIEEINPDVTLTNIRMPKMSGLEMLKKIKERNPKRCVIMHTACYDKKEEAKALGADGYITKPCRLNKLLNIIMRKIG